MRITSVLRNLSLAAVLVTAIPTFAKPVTSSLPITHDVRLGQVNLKAGDYNVKIDGTHLTLFRGKTVVAQSEGRWEDRDTKSAYNSIVSNVDGAIIELRFEGKKSVFVLAQ